MKKDREGAGWTRRDFLSASVSGAGLLLAPAFMAGCGGAMRNTAVLSGPGTGEDAAGYFTRFGIDEASLRRIIDAAMSSGGDFADLFFQHRVSNRLSLEDAQVSQAVSSVELGCGVRVLRGDQTGFAFTEDLSPDALLSAANTAAAVAAGPASATLASVRRGSRPSYYEAEIPWEAVSIDRKIPLLARADSTARAFDSKIIKVAVHMTDSSSRILLATSEGRIVEDTQPMTTMRVACVARKGTRREENGTSFGCRQGFEAYTFDKMDELARFAAQRTMILFEASQPPAGEYPVVLSPGLSGILLHEAIGHGMEADFNRKGISVYSGRIGQPIAPKFVTIVDDGTNPNNRGSINIDDEGRESMRTVLVEDGILRSYMHDRISAKHYGIESTANGRRDCYRFPPVPRMRNTYMLNGPHDPEEIIRSVVKGVYAERFANGQVRIGSGDFSFYLKNGYLIENGKLTRPVKDANLIGFGPEVLEKMEMVGNDMAMNAGAGMCGKDGQGVPVGFGLPTVKCRGISVGGVA